MVLRLFIMSPRSALTSPVSCRSACSIAPVSWKATFNPATLSRNLIQESLDVGDEVTKTASSKLVGTRKSRLAECRKLEQQLAAQLAELDAMKNDSGLKVEMALETKLRGLLGEYGYSLRDVISLLDPAAAQRSNSEPSSASPKRVTRKARELKAYIVRMTHD